MKALIYSVTAKKRVWVKPVEAKPERVVGEKTIAARPARPGRWAQRDYFVGTVDAGSKQVAEKKAREKFNMKELTVAPGECSCGEVFALGHSFNDDMTCITCGIEFIRHQKTRQSCPKPVIPS